MVLTNWVDVHGDQLENQPRYIWFQNEATKRWFQQKSTSIKGPWGKRKKEKKGKDDPKLKWRISMSRKRGGVSKTLFVFSFSFYKFHYDESINSFQELYS